MSVVRDIVIIPHEIDEADLSVIGSRAMSRVTLAKLKVPVPAAIVITSHCFYRFLNHANGLNRWQKTIENTPLLHPEAIAETARSLQKLVSTQPFADDLAHEIGDIYERTFHHSWAHITISPTPITKAPVNFPLPVIKGETALIDFLRQIWSAQITPHAISLHHAMNSSIIFEPAPILVSQFKPATMSGSISTVDPITHNKQLMRLEAIWGTNPQNDPRPIEPDTYVINKTTNAVISHNGHHQSHQLSVDRFGMYSFKKISEKQQNQLKLSDEQITELTKIAKLIHNAKLQPQRINWLIADKKIWITRFQNLDTETVPHTRITTTAGTPDQNVLAHGLCASPGITTAPLTRPSITRTSVTGMIVVVKSADLRFFDQIKSAAGLIIESGGLTSELAQAAHALGIPTLVGTGPIPTSNDHIVTLNAIKGIVYQEKSQPRITITQELKPLPDQLSEMVTATKILLQLNRLLKTEERCYLAADGVGLVSGTDLIVSLATHPKYLIKKNKAEFVHQLHTGLLSISEQFGTRPVWYAPIDFMTITAAHLAHGAQFEPQEENPLLGFRGATRAISDPSIFDTEIAIIAQLRNKYNRKNLHLITPLIRHEQEYVHIKKRISSQGLYRSPSFKVFVQIGTPAGAQCIDAINEIGCDGLVIDLDLTATLLLGYDPNSAEVSQWIDLNHHAVTQWLSACIKQSAAHQLPVHIRSHQLDQKFDLINTVIKCGATGIIIPPCRYDTVKQWVHDSEVRIASTHKKLG